MSPQRILQKDMHRYSLFGLFALLLGVMPAIAQAQSLTDAQIVAVDSIAQNALDGTLAGAPPVAGMAVGIAHDGEVVLSEAYGLADVHEERPLERHSIFRIGSVSKPFTAAAVLRFVEEGRINLSDDVRDHLPNAPTQGQEVTIEQLLNHTSGIPSYTSRSDFMWQTGEKRTHDEMLAMMKSDSLDFAPGSEYAYNNSGYYLLGLLVEELSGVSYVEHLKETMFDPLGLGDTLYCPDEPENEQQARGYRPSPMGAGPMNATAISMTQPYAAGALCSTVEDLLTWRAALDRGDVISAEMLERMQQASVAGEDTLSYGLGIQVGERQGHRFVGHGGGINGFISQWIHFPDDQWTVVVLTNTEGAAAFRAEEAISRMLLDLPSTEYHNLSLSAEELAQFEGTYDIGPMNLRIFASEGDLYAQGDGQPAFRLLAQGGGVFLATFDPSVRIVFSIDDGQATELTLHQAGQIFTGSRLDD